LEVFEEVGGASLGRVLLRVIGAHRT
jgi:hypothetical protein